MRKLSLIASALIVVAIGITLFNDVWQSPGNKILSREEYEDFLNDHPYTELLNTPAKEKGEEEEPEGDNPDMAMLQNFLMTMDPAQMRPTPWVMESTSKKTALIRDADKHKVFESATSLSTGTAWTERGPKQVGGRTRALMFDPNDPNKRKVWAGGVSGGLWVNQNITDANSPWQKVDDLWDNLAITCIASDPVNTQIFYVGTGEGWFNTDAVVGAGIWKTINGGATWTQLASTSAYTFVNDIVVRNESSNGVVYAGVRNSSASNNGLFRSDNGGTSWTQVLPASISQEYPTDIEVGKDNKLYVGAKSKIGGNAAIYLSTNATGTTWDTQNYPYDGRVEIACSPSNEQIAYVVIEDNNEIGVMGKTVNGGATWTTISTPVDADLGIPSDDFSRSQAWYDLILAVHPTNPDFCITGAINLYSTANGGSSWSQISKWSNNANMNSLNCSVVHADQHAIQFRPGFSNEIIVGNDGGVYYATNVSGAATANVFSERNLDYNVTQFYTAAIHPALPNFMLGGTQDNGTPKFTAAGLGNTVDVYGGDGGMCFIDQNTPTFQIASYVRNVIGLSTDGGNTFPISLIDDESTGNFINQGDYDSNLKVLFTAKSSSEIYRVKNVTTTRNLESIPINLGTIATALRISPHNVAASNLYIGTLAGKLFKVLNADGSSITPVEITGPSFPNGAISSIAFGIDEDQILVTFSNYGVISVWETRNGGATWTNREGNLPNMPVRWVEYHPQNFDQVYLATELGVWTTDNINIASPVWNSTNGGLANVRTDMLRVRKSDGAIMAATHGRGVFTAIIPSNLDQAITFNTITGTKTFGDGTFNLTAQSTSGLPVTFESSNTSVVTIAGNTVTIVGAGTVDISANQPGNTYYAAADPEVQTVVVNKSTQTITFAALPEKDIDDADFTLTASATSGLSVSFASDNPGVASVAGNLLSINGAGSATITASQGGNANFLAAANVALNFTVVTRIIDISADLDFGDVFIGERPTKTFTIRNTGTGSLQVTDITYPDAYEGETKTVSDGIEVTVTFTPDNVAEFSGDIVIESNATSGNNTVPVSGSGILITSSAQNPEDGFEVYPNPVKDLLLIKTEAQTPETILIVDMAGRELKFNRTSLREYTAEFDVSRLSKGTYILKVPKEGGYFTKQINKQ